MYLPVFFVALLCLSHWSSACDILDRGVSDQDRQEIVKKHNQLRAKVANGQEKGWPTASNMRELVWDDKLAKAAQDWAEKCVYEHDDPSERGGDGHTGQNIANQVNSEKAADWSSPMRMWYDDEVELYDPSDLSSYKFDPASGHFTQIVWAETNRIGCGYVRHSAGGQSKHLYGCNYAPGGNMLRSPMYIEGAPCSKCGGCGSIEGLCGKGGKATSQRGVSENDEGEGGKAAQRDVKENDDEGGKAAAQRDIGKNDEGEGDKAAQRDVREKGEGEGGKTAERDVREVDEGEGGKAAQRDEREKGEASAEDLKGRGALDFMKKPIETIKKVVDLVEEPLDKMKDIFKPQSAKYDTDKE